MLKLLVTRLFMAATQLFMAGLLNRAKLKLIVMVTRLVIHVTACMAPPNMGAQFPLVLASLAVPRLVIFGAPMGLSTRLLFRFRRRLGR